MDSKTAIDFVNKLLKQTKTHEIKWELAQRTFTHVTLSDPAYYYVANTRQGEIVIGKTSYSSNDIHMFITPMVNMSPGATYDLSDFISWYDKENAPKYKECLKELFGFVYHSLPNADSFITTFLDN